MAPRQSLSRAIVQTPTKAVRIGAAQLHDAWEKSPRIRDLVDRHNEALFGHAIQSVACNALHSVEARFCRWLLTCHDRISSNTVALTQEFLADMLGVQRTTVTAVARSLQDKGAIRYRRGRRRHRGPGRPRAAGVRMLRRHLQDLRAAAAGGGSATATCAVPIFAVS